MNFELVKKHEGADCLPLPERATKSSAGYDFRASEDIIIPSYQNIISVLDKKEKELQRTPWDDPLGLDEIANLTKGYRPTLIPTGVKCKLEKNQFLQLSVRSSGPLKHWLILGNGVGIIDADYYGNPDNDGEIFFQVINLLPFPIQIRKGDKIGQGVILNYIVTDEDQASGERSGGFGSTDA